MADPYDPYRKKKPLRFQASDSLPGYGKTIFDERNIHKDPAPRYGSGYGKTIFDERNIPPFPASPKSDAAGLGAGYSGLSASSLRIPQPGAPTQTPQVPNFPAQPGENEPKEQETPAFPAQSLSVGAEKPSQSALPGAQGQTPQQPDYTQQGTSPYTSSYSSRDDDAFASATQRITRVDELRQKVFGTGTFEARPFTLGGQDVGPPQQPQQAEQRQPQQTSSAPSVQGFNSKGAILRSPIFQPGFQEQGIQFSSPQSGAYATHPDAYKTNPRAYNQTSADRYYLRAEQRAQQGNRDDENRLYRDNRRILIRNQRNGR